MDDPEQKQRIKLWMAWALIIVAIFIDLVEILTTYTGVGVFIAEGLAVAATFGFWYWFQILGVSYISNTKRFVLAIIQAVGELIPGLDAIPFWFLWTFGMILIVILTRMEDRGQKPTILGALGRIVTYSNLASGNPTIWMQQKYKDVRRVGRQRSELQNKKIEMMQNPERMAEIRAKYAKREARFKKKELSMPERIEGKFFDLKPGGISFKEGKGKEDVQKAMGNLLDLKEKVQTKASNFGFKKAA